MTPDDLEWGEIPAAIVSLLGVIALLVAVVA